MESGNRKKLGEILVDHNFITQDQLVQGLEKHKITKKRLGEILAELGFITEERLAQALAIQGENPPRDSILAGSPALTKGKKIG